MIRYLVFLSIIFSLVIKAQSKIIIIDSTFNCFYIDESTPLPFNPDITFNFGIPDTANVRIEIHEILSNSISSEIINTVPVSTIVEGIFPQGKYQVFWDGTDNNGKKLNNKKYIYYLYAIRKVNTIGGIGYIKIEAKSKVIFPIN